MRIPMNLKRIWPLIACSATILVACSKANGQRKDKVAGMDTSKFPVEMVSWEDAVDFCKKLSDLTAEKEKKRLYRLPTEAEWEYACRGGTTSPYHFGKTITPKDANYY